MVDDKGHYATIRSSARAAELGAPLLRGGTGSALEIVFLTDYGTDNVQADVCSGLDYSLDARPDQDRSQWILCRVRPYHVTLLKRTVM